MLAHAHVTQTPTCASTCTCTFTCLQSEWDLASGRAPDYAGVMVSLATDALRSRPRGDRRVLMLGLGGGSAPGEDYVLMDLGASRSTCPVSHAPMVPL